MYAEVVLTRPTHHRPPAGSDPLRDDISRLQVFTYRLPERLRDAIAVGHLVQAPLGAGMALGVVAAVSPEPSPRAPPVLREVSDLLDPLPVVTPGQVDLARWIAEEYLAPLSEAMKLMLPPGLEERTSIVISQRAPESTAALSAEEEAALWLLTAQGGVVPLRTLLARLRGEDAEALVNGLVERGLVQAKYALVPPRPAPPRVRYVSLLADDRAIQAALPHLGRPSIQADLLLAIARRADTPPTVAQLCEWAGCTPAPVRALAQRGWVTVTQPRTLVVATPAGSPEAGIGLARAPRQAAALAALCAQGGPVELQPFLDATGTSPGILKELERRGAIRCIAEPAVVLLALPYDQVLDKVVELRGAERDRAVLEAMQGTAGRVWVGGIYAQTGADLSTLHRLATWGLISLHAELRDRPGAAATAETTILTPDQEQVWRELSRELASPREAGPPTPALLHGAAGSVQTEIYLRAVEQVLASGRRAIVLVSEMRPVVGLSDILCKRFPGRVVVHHGRLSLGQRYETWDRARRGEIDVLVGTRSALFVPIPRLGLIVIHDAHDESYKQEEPIPQPSYHACDVAAELGRLTGAAVLYSSTTPDVVMYSRAGKSTLRLLELPRPPQPAGLPPIQVVDLRQELRAGNRSIFSRSLQQALASTLSARRQAILFLNRRGAATFVLCRGCGYVATCPRCDTPLTFHGFERSAVGTRPSLQRRVNDGAERLGFEQLVCHRCNYRQPAPSSCPQCGSRHIRHFGLGTERVEAELRESFPEVRVLRWDRDAAAGLEGEQHLQTFLDHGADLLVGTEMVASIADLPLVALVGVISADAALNLPDYRAAERAFQLLTQVAALAGGARDGAQVIIQTYRPDHYAIRSVAARDYAAFFRQEEEFRHRSSYPPYGRLLALRYQHVERRVCQTEAERLGAWLQAEIRRQDLVVDLIGPAPCYHARILGRYRWQIVLRGVDPAALLRDVALPRGWRIDVDPVTLL